MTVNKHPDNVVFNIENNTYDAYLKEYPTHIGAPIIETVDTVAWKNKNLQLVNSEFKAQFDHLKQSLDAFKDLFKDNQLVYSAKFNFEPIVGKIYHLYTDINNKKFLSILSPDECDFQFYGSYYLNKDKLWIKQ